MDSVTYNNQQVKAYKKAKNILDILDIDTRNAVDDIESVHPRIAPTASNLCHLVGHFITTPEGIPLVDIIISDACNEFVANIDTQGKRLAYRAYMLAIKTNLHLLFDYSINVIFTPTKHRQFDLLSETIFGVIPDHGCKLQVAHCPISSHLSNHELSLLLFHRVFSRGDLLNMGVPHAGYQSVFNMKNQQRY